MTRDWTAAIETLRSRNFFDRLRGAMLDLGLGKDASLGMGIFFIATSGFQAYPLRLNFEVPVDTAKTIVRKVSRLLLPGTVIDPVEDEEWHRLTDSAHQKLVFIPEWARKTANGTDVCFDIHKSKLIRVSGVSKNESAHEIIAETEINFACILADRFREWKRRPRWVTMQQTGGSTDLYAQPRPPLPDDYQTWHGVQLLLQERARLPVVFPEWKPIAVEQMCEADYRAGAFVPAFIQAWHTMCLIRSFQSDEGKKPRSLQANFLDLAATVLLSKKLFREGRWFPSPKNLFRRISNVGDQTALLHPVTGKGVRYKHEVKAPVQWPSIFSNTEEED